MHTACKASFTIVVALSAVAVACGASGRGLDRTAAAPSGPPAEDSGAGGGPGIELAAVSWRVFVDPEGVSIAEDGGWTVTTDTGWEVVVSEAWAELYTGQLEPCALGARWDVGAPFSSVARAHALPGDPSAVRASHPIALMPGVVKSLDSRRFSPARYCAVGTSWIRADATTVALPQPPELMDLSLYVDLAYRGVGDADRTPVALRSAPPAESDLPLAVGRPTGTEIQVELVIARMFDGIDLGDAPERVARDVLANIARGARAVQL